MSLTSATMALFQATESVSANIRLDHMLNVMSINGKNAAADATEHATEAVEIVEARKESKPIAFSVPKDTRRYHRSPR